MALPSAENVINTKNVSSSIFNAGKTDGVISAPKLSSAVPDTVASLNILKMSVISADIRPELKKISMSTSGDDTALVILGSILKMQNLTDKSLEQVFNFASRFYTSYLSECVEEMKDDLSDFSEKIQILANEVESKNNIYSVLKEEKDKLLQDLNAVTEDDPERQIIMDKITDLEVSMATLSKEIAQLQTKFNEIFISFISKENVITNFNKICGYLKRANVQLTASGVNNHQLFFTLINTFINILVKGSEELRDTLQKIKKEFVDAAQAEATRKNQEAVKAAEESEKSNRNFNIASKAIGLALGILGIIIGVATAWCSGGASAGLIVGALTVLFSTYSVVNDIWYFGNGCKAGAIEEGISKATEWANKQLKALLKTFLPKIVEMCGGSKEQGEDAVEIGTTVVSATIITAVGIGLTCALGAAGSNTLLAEGITPLVQSILVGLQGIKGGVDALVILGQSIAGGVLAWNSKEVERLGALSESLQTLLSQALELQNRSAEQRDRIDEAEYIKKLMSDVLTISEADKKKISVLRV